MTEYSTAKTGEYPRIFPNFQNCARCEKDLKDNKDNSRHLGRKYARIFVLEYYLFLEAHSFPRASLSENCSLLGTDNVCGQISEHIFAPNGDYCLYNHSRGWENSRQLCKPSTSSRVCITVENSPNPSSGYIRLCKHRKKVFYCFYKILLKINSTNEGNFVY